MYHKCRECNTKFLKTYRATKSGMLKQREQIKKYEAKNPGRRKAWNIASKITKSPCERCGNTNVHRHHPDINKPLEVIFLCPQHHKEAHKVLVYLPWKSCVA